MGRQKYDITFDFSMIMPAIIYFKPYFKCFYREPANYTTLIMRIQTKT